MYRLVTPHDEGCMVHRRGVVIANELGREKLGNCAARF